MKYNILYVDPPWSYDNKKTGGSMKSGALTKYPTMPLADLCALPMPEVADKNSVLFLWATVPLMPEAFQVMTAWGFKYKTMLTWVKTGKLGMGFWFRGQTEHLLVGIRGKVKPFKMQETNVVTLPALDHSTKPQQFRLIIDNATRYMEPQNRLEIFARQTGIGWTAIGNQIDGITVQEALQQIIQEPQPNDRPATKS